jgi:hypothetical protein
MISKKRRASLACSPGHISIIFFIVRFALVILVAWIAWLILLISWGVLLLLS